MPDTATIERTRTAEAVESTPSEPRRRGLPVPSIATLFGACFAAFAWAIQLRPLQDNSFLWHLRTGHWILGNGIPQSDIFSFTAHGAPWVVQSWLAEVLYAGIDSAFGPFGLRVLRGAMSALIAFLVYRLANRLTGEHARAAMLTTAALAAGFTLWSERPLLFGVLFMVVLLWTVEVPDSFAGRRPLIVLPLLMWTWANMHGTFALGFVYLSAHLAGQILDGKSLRHDRPRALLIASALALGACFLNPLGIQLLTFPIHLLARGDVLNQILEWKSPDFHSMIGILFAIWVAIFVFGVAGAGRRPSRRDLLVSAGFLLLGLWALRNVALAPLATLPVVARALAAGEKPRAARAGTLNLVVLALLVVLGFSATGQALAENDYNLTSYPVEAMKVVEERGLLGSRLLTTDAWSAYVIHEYWPKQQVFMDDRYDMFPTELAEDYFKLARVDDGWDEVLNRHDIQVIVWPKEKPLTRVLDLAPGWERIHGDDLGGIWVRRPAS